MTFEAQPLLIQTGKGPIQVTDKMVKATDKMVKTTDKWVDDADPDSSNLGYD